MKKNKKKKNHTKKTGAERKVTIKVFLDLQFLYVMDLL